MNPGNVIDRNITIKPGFLAFGYDVNGRMNQLAIVTGEGHGIGGKELFEAILAAVKGFEKVGEDENQVWLRES